MTFQGDEFPRRLSDPLQTVILFYHVSLQTTSGNVKQQSLRGRGSQSLRGDSSPDLLYRNEPIHFLANPTHFYMKGKSNSKKCDVEIYLI